MKGMEEEKRSKKRVTEAGTQEGWKAKELKGSDGKAEGISEGKKDKTRG